MIRYERKKLANWKEVIENILENYKLWLTSWKLNLKTKSFWKSNKILVIVLSIPVILSLAYLYLWIQNSFTPYSTAWDANHEYMYIPKILAENAWIYRWNTVANNMPGFWHQFLTFIFSLTWCTNWWLWLSADNIAISMNNISATFVLLFWIAVIFQIFALIKNDKKSVDETDKNNLKIWKEVVTQNLEYGQWITMWWYILLLWLTWWMWAFLVIVDNKTDLWVMALSLLALLAGLIFLQNRKNKETKRELLKYVIVAWLFFGFAALAKITAFVDFVLFGFLLVGLRFSPLVSVWLWIMVMWLVRKFNVLTSAVMLTDTNAMRLIIVWLFITILWFVLHILKHSNRKEVWKSLYYLIIFLFWFLAPLILLKLPWSIISQVKTDNFSFNNSLKSVFLSKNLENHVTRNNKLLAQNISSWITNISVEENSDSSNLETQDIVDTSILNLRVDKTFSQCNSVWNIYSDKELSENLKELNGWWWGEDLWRYIWYGRKEFKNENVLRFSNEWTWTRSAFNFMKALWPKTNSCGDLSNTDGITIAICEKNLMYWIMKMLWPTSDKCYWFNRDAKILCNNAGVIENFKIDDLRWIYENWLKNKEWEAWKLLKQAIDAYDKAKLEWKLWLWSSSTSIFHDEIVNLRQYYQSHSIYSDKDSINIPYRYLVPLNISFNWSLQNLSSYYTDIGFVWIVIFIILIISLPYALIKKDKVLTSISLTTLIGWWIWWIIWSSILWYWTALISRSMITIAITWDNFMNKKDKNLKIIPYILIFIVWLFFCIQIIFNYLRIASQWASSVFVWYKWNVGIQQIVDDNLKSIDDKWNQLTKVKYWYWWKNIFDLQFPQYNSIINALANRKKDEWVIIAWTYIQYFLGNQWNIKWDWMLNTFRKNSSDWDLCKTYRRLKNDNTRYLIIDPNIWTVTMWEWNETLFYRFFWKLNSTKSEIEIDGTITTLVRLAKLWYINLLSTNNLWAKYAFILDDDTIKQAFGNNLTDEELILTRSKMAVLQYFSDANSIFSSIADIFISRISSNAKLWIEDIADAYWLEVDSEKISNIASKYINTQSVPSEVKNLTQNERLVLINYLNLYGAIKANSQDVVTMVQRLLMNSVTWWSQIIALELN